MLEDVPIKKNNPPPPDWIVPGVLVEHDTFGRGRVARVGLYKRIYAVWIDFDEVGTKALEPQFAVPHLRRLSP